MFPKKETLEIEFKSDLKKLNDQVIVEEVVALANTNGGTLYIGIEDDGTITGAAKEHLSTYQAAAFISSKTVPPVSVECEIVDNVLLIKVPKSTSVVATTRGRILKRRIKSDGSPKSTPMYPFEISTRLSDLGKLDFTAQIVPEATLDDFDEVEIQRIRSLIESRNYSDKYLLELSNVDLLKSLRMAVEHQNGVVPTVCGLVLAGKERSIKKFVPTSISSLQVFEGTNIRVNRDFTCGLLQAIEEISSGIEAWNPVTELNFGLINESVHLYNKSSIREALVNAFGHRDYSVLKRVIVKIDEMGMLISSPGSFIEGVNTKNLLTVEPHGRNPALMDALKRIGLAERTGRGIDRIYEGTLLYGRPAPDYSDSDSTKVSVFFTAVQPDSQFYQIVSSEQERLHRTMPISSLLTLSTIKHYHRLTFDELFDLTSINKSLLRKTLESLIEAGLVENVGSRVSGEYILGSTIYKREGKTKEYVRQSGIEKVRRPELIMELLKQTHKITVEDVAQLLRVDKNSAYYEIKKLINAGKIRSAKRGRGAYYIEAPSN